MANPHEINRILLQLGILPPTSGADARARVEAAAATSRKFRDWPVYDFEKPSLQRDLLDLAQRRRWLDDVDAEFLKAEASRRVAMLKLQRLAVLGIHSKMKHVPIRSREFQDFELDLIFKSVSVENPLLEFQSVAFRGMVEQWTRAGCASELNTVVLGMLKIYWPFSSKKGAKNPVNEKAFVAAALWTCPSCPLWLMPGRAASKIVARLSRRKHSHTALLAMARREELHRIPDAFVNRLAAVPATDVEAVAVRKRFESVMGISMADVRRGARSGR